MNNGVFNVFIAQIVLIIVLFIVVFWFLKINKASFVEKRYKKFCIEPISNNEIPILDRISMMYRSFIKRLSKHLNKSKAMKDYSKKYEKYINRTLKRERTAMDFVSTKVVWGIFGFVIIILSDILRGSGITLYQLLLAFLLGFFAPDIYWYSIEKLRKREIDKNMLKAIIIMNNSFKSGLSIMQAIYMVSTELDGPVADEFKKMYIDISFGLDMDLVFERFAKRINTEEAHYITASLTVLNKTGGNIVEVFASVERSAFTRKKLKEELDSMAASANAIYKILVAIPVIISLIIVLLNPKYFAPLFVTSIGRIILALILLIYVSYIVIVRRIVKMKGY